MRYQYHCIGFRVRQEGSLSGYRMSKLMTMCRVVIAIMPPQPACQQHLPARSLASLAAKRNPGAAARREG